MDVYSLSVFLKLTIISNNGYIVLYVVHTVEHAGL